MILLAGYEHVGLEVQRVHFVSASLTENFLTEEEGQDSTDNMRKLAMFKMAVPISQAKKRSRELDQGERGRRHLSVDPDAYQHRCTCQELPENIIGYSMEDWCRAVCIVAFFCYRRTGRTNIGLETAPKQNLGL
ncbi:hypothetical protein EsH8_IV_000072 [Colletotrichum jinshuiense]